MKIPSHNELSSITCTDHQQNFVSAFSKTTELLSSDSLFSSKFYFQLNADRIFLANLEFSTRFCKTTQNSDFLTAFYRSFVLSNMYESESLCPVPYDFLATIGNCTRWYLCIKIRVCSQSIHWFPKCCRLFEASFSREKNWEWSNVLVFFTIKIFLHVSDNFVIDSVAIWMLGISCNNFFRTVCSNDKKGILTIFFGSCDFP